MKLPAFLARTRLDEHGDLIEVSVWSRVWRIAVVLFILALNVLLILRAAVSCSIPLSGTVILSDVGRCDLAASALHLPKLHDFSSFSVSGAREAHVYRLYPVTDPAEDMGHLMTSDVCYLSGAGILEFTLRQNTRFYPEVNEAGEPTLSALVRVVDEKGVRHFSDTSIARTKTEKKGDYLYTRVEFDRLNINLGKDYVTLYVFRTGEEDDTLLTVTLHGQTSTYALSSLSGQTYLHL